MTNRQKLLFVLVMSLALVPSVIFILKQNKKAPAAVVVQGDDAMSFNLSARQMWEYKRLRDPNTGKVPDNIRAKELAFAATLPHDGGLRKSGDIWNFVGPWNVGGRTRAIAIDANNENVIIAGGATGGLWRTEDGGQTWAKTTTPAQVTSITCVTQDTRAGKTNVWYAGTGELSGSSGTKGGAYFSGNGLLKSTDGGKSWQPIATTAINTPQFDSDFDGIWNIAVNHTVKDSDVVFVATYGGIYRTVNSGTSWQRRRGSSSPATSYYTDVAITKGGTVYATLSSESSNRGIWRSADNGTTWANIIPGSFPATYQRMVIGLVPGFENQLYILAVTPGKGKLTKNFKGDEEWNSLWKYTYVSGDGTGAGGIWEDRSANIPDFPGDFETFNAQGGYNYLVRVKPNDTNVVYIAGTGLFRSADGFKTTTKITRIGGYAPGTKRPDFKLYENHHPDQHNLVFFPSNPNKAISTHDGGISLTDDITAQSVKWKSLNNGYATTQFYTVAINEKLAGDKTIIGGLQDNGTLFTNKFDHKHPWNEIFSYDGAFCHVASNGLDYYVAKQEAGLYRIRLDNNNQRVQSARLDPPKLEGYTFINPWCVDPNDDKRLFLINDTSIWRSNDVTLFLLDNFLDSSRDMGNWQELTNTRLREDITAISMSVQPAGILFYGTENGKLYKVANATTGDPIPTDIRGTNFPSGNINNICVHPDDANKLIVVFTNYGIPSVFYTDNGGQSWMDISGNLEQNPNGTGNGPSCRWAAFVKTGASYGVLLGTSVGLFGAPALNGSSTVWVQQSKETIGNAIVDMIKVRYTDGWVVAATHGSGVFAASIYAPNHLTGIKDVYPALNFTLYPNPAADVLTVSLKPEFEGNKSIIVTDMLGKEVLKVSYSEGVTHELQVGALLPGTYTLTVETKNARATKLFVRK